MGHFNINFSIIRCPRFAWQMKVKLVSNEFSYWKLSHSYFTGISNWNIFHSYINHSNFLSCFNSSNWGQKSKTRVLYWWSCISLFAHVFRVKCIHSPTTHSPTIQSPTWKLFLPCLWPTKKKHQSRMLVDLKKTKFARAGVQARSSSRSFHPEATGAGGKFNLKNYTGWNANSYINTRILLF